VSVVVLIMLTDTLIKQQLSSLSYVRTVCNTRQQQLSDGVADTDGVLPGVRVFLSSVLFTKRLKTRLFSFAFNVC